MNPPESAVPLVMRPLVILKPWISEPCHPTRHAATLACHLTRVMRPLLHLWSPTLARVLPSHSSCFHSCLPAHSSCFHSRHVSTRSHRLKPWILASMILPESAAPLVVHPLVMVKPWISESCRRTRHASTLACHPYYGHPLLLGACHPTRRASRLISRTILLDTDTS